MRMLSSVVPRCSNHLVSSPPVLLQELITITGWCITPTRSPGIVTWVHTAQPGPSSLVVGPFPYCSAVLQALSGLAGSIWQLCECPFILTTSQVMTTAGAFHTRPQHALWACATNQSCQGSGEQVWAVSTGHQSLSAHTIRQQGHRASRISLQPVLDMLCDPCGPSTTASVCVAPAGGALQAC